MFEFDPMFMLYAQACEGDLTAGQSKLNNVAEILAYEECPNDTYTFQQVCERCGVDFGWLSVEEVEYVLRKAEEIAG